jgi:hypothetical protein
MFQKTKFKSLHEFLSAWVSRIFSNFHALSHANIVNLIGGPEKEQWKQKNSTCVGLYKLGFKDHTN